MSITEKSVSGIVVPMLTPFTSQLEIDLQAVERIVSNFVTHGVDLLLLGTTGEGPLMASRQKQELVGYVGEGFSGRIRIYATVINTSVEEAVEAAKRYASLGSDFIVSPLPGYYPLTPDQMRCYFETLADASPKPVILYNIPATTHQSLPLEVVEQLSHHPNIAGMKDSERDLERYDRAIQLFKGRRDFSYLVGWGALSFSALVKGSDGLVPSTGNFSPGMFKQIYLSVRRGDLRNAEHLQAETDEVAKVYQSGRSLGESLAAAKLIMQALGFCEPYMMPPLTRLSAEEELAVKGSWQRLQERVHIY